MDPNANIEELLRLAEDIRRIENEGELSERYALAEREVIQSAERMAELILALDEWLYRGGFMPQRWQYASRR